MTEKKSAFSVLQQASKQKNAFKALDRDQKRQRLASPGESNFSHCPVCSHLFPKALLPAHANHCLDGGPARVRSAAAATRSENPALEPATRSAAAASQSLTPSLQSQAEPPLASQHLQTFPARQDVRQAPPDASQPPASNAFQRLMQHSREQSRVHNFYLELKPAGTWHWHWWTTQGGRQQACVPEQASVLQNPADGQDRLGVEQKSATYPAAAQHGSQVTTAEERAVKHECSTSEALPSSPQPDQQESVPAAEPKNTPKTHQQQLPKAAWSAMTQLSTARLGGTAKQKVTVRLLTNAPPGDAGVASWTEPGFASNAKQPGGRFRGSISVLKSALQKNVRLCRAGSAVRCALFLIKEDVAEFLRRCSIICLEDSLLHPALPLLVWLMAAQAKGYSLGLGQVSACLRVVHHLADCPVRDFCPEVSPVNGAPAVRLFDDTSGLHEEAAILVRCILIRAAFGGMSGDVRMLVDFARLWAARFSGQAAPPPVGSGPAGVGTTPGRQEGQLWLQHVWALTRTSQASLDPDALYNVRRVGPLTKDDIPVSAIDFHVSSIVEELMQMPAVDQTASAEGAKVGAEPALLLQRAMWHFRSSTNKKAMLGGDAAVHQQGLADDGQKQVLAAIWAVAREPANTWSANFIARRFS